MGAANLTLAARDLERAALDYGGSVVPIDPTAQQTQSKHDSASPMGNNSHNSTPKKGPGRIRNRLLELSQDRKDSGRHSEIELSAIDVGKISLLP